MKKSERPKASKQEDGVDFISNMPDAILVLILSRLPSTEEQIRSSILSQRWRYLWTAIPSVEMEFDSYGKSKQSEFKEFGYWVLANKTVDLDSFCLWCDDYFSMSTIWRWVHLAVTKNVKELDLCFCTKDQNEVIELPRFLLSCGSLEVLRLDLMSNCGLSLPKFVGFPALRVLHLTQVDLPEEDELVNDFLKSLPLLEDLSLIGCSIGELVCISWPKLKRLSIVILDDVGCHGIEISCPELEDLELGGCIGEGNTDPVLFHGNPHFKPLWMQIYFSCESINAACNPALPNVKTLVLRTSLDAFTMDNFNRILKYCPKLENLKLTITKDTDEEYERLDEAQARRLMTSDVKRVEFFEFNGEKPKLVIDWCEDILEMVFSWG